MVKLDDDERIIRIVRKHWYVMLGFTFGLFVLALAPFILAKIVNLLELFEESSPVSGFVDGFIGGYGLFAYFLWVLVLWVIFFIEWTDYYLDVWILTNKRIVDIEQRGFFHRHVTSFRYEQIQDITVNTKGLIATFFKFGTLHIHTAGSTSGTTEHDDIIIDHAANPEEIRTLVAKEQEKNYMHVKSF
ncbi:MAG: PH domain-containing protein [Patescibacteria group bacterium]